MTWFGIATYELNGRAATGLAVGNMLYDAQAVLKQTASAAPLADVGTLIAGWEAGGAATVERLEA
ncbi:MAG: FAA hydrolase family protein, partial [Paraburkholderia sp.]